MSPRSQLQRPSLTASSTKLLTISGGGGSFGTLLVSVFKVYGRRFQNISWLVYVVCLAAMINILFGDTFMSGAIIGPIIMSSAIFSMLAIVVASDVTLRGKETLFLYKKIPSGVGMLLKTRLIQGWLVIIPITAAIMVTALSLIPDTSLSSVLAYTVPIVLIAAADMAFALGIFLLIPAYAEKGGEYMLNMVIIIQVSLFLFIGCIEIFGEMKGLFMMILFSWLLGVAFLLLGKRKLSRME